MNLNKEKLLEEISEKNFKLCKYSKMAVSEENFREFIVNELLTNTDIMVYYHAYYIVDSASKENPELFYKYWNKLAKLRKHKNSYHRSIAHWIITNLIPVDAENKIDSIMSWYLYAIYDEKYQTGLLALRDINQMVKTKPDMLENIVNLYLEFPNRNKYKEKSAALMNYDIIEFFEENYENIKEKNQIINFIIMNTESISPKTMKKAKQVIKKLGVD